MTTVGRTAAFDRLRFAEDVQSYRERLGMSLRDFVRDRDVGFNTVARVEKGQDATIGNLLEIAAAANLDLRDYL